MRNNHLYFIMMTILKKHCLILKKVQTIMNLSYNDLRIVRIEGITNKVES